MDINSSKKTLLSLINGNILGASPSENQTVKFQIATGVNAIARAAASTTAGALTFASDNNGNAAIFATDGNGTGTLVSSKILNITSAAASSNLHGGKTVTITYVDTAQTSGTNTATFDVIDEAGLEAYFTGSKTIALDGTTNVYEVKLKENGGLAVDSNGIYAVLDNIFAVDGKTIAFKDDNKTIETKVKIAYVAADQQTGQKAAIQLQDADSTKLSEVTVESLIGSGIVESTSYDKATNTLTITWVGGATTDIVLTDIFDISDWAVQSGSEDYISLTINSSDGTAEIGVTQKLKTGIGLAESALQGLSEGSSTENYVSLTIADGTEPSTKTVAINDAALKTKIDEIDGSIGDISTLLASKTSEIDSSIDRLDVSVSGIETQIAAMDADISTAVALDATNGIYVRGTLTENNGVVETIGLTTKIADTSITRYDKDGDIDPAWELNEDGLLNGDAATKLKNYVDDVAAQIKDEAGAVDSSKSDADSANFISIHEEQEDGAITVFTVDSSYGSYNYTAGTHTFGTPTDGLAKVADTQTFVQGVIESLDLTATVSDASAVDAAGFVKTTISETDGIVKNESVEVTYGNYSTHANGIAKTADTSIFVQEQITNALTWTILP